MNANVATPFANEHRRWWRNLDRKCRWCKRPLLRIAPRPDAPALCYLCDNTPPGEAH